MRDALQLLGSFARAVVEAIVCFLAAVGFVFLADFIINGGMQL